MCDYSLHAVKTRDAEVGDELIVVNFGTGTRGFGDRKERADSKGCWSAVCLRPGTEVVFDEPIEVYDQSYGMVKRRSLCHSTAIFRKLNEDKPNQHHDALELPDGITVLLTLLCDGQRATVLQLPKFFDPPINVLSTGRDMTTVRDQSGNGFHASGDVTVVKTKRAAAVLAASQEYMDV